MRTVIPGTDFYANIPANYTFNAADGGGHLFQVTFGTLGLPIGRGEIDDRRMILGRAVKCYRRGAINLQLLSWLCRLWLWLGQPAWSRVPRGGGGSPAYDISAGRPPPTKPCL